MLDAQTLQFLTRHQKKGKTLPFLLSDVQSVPETAPETKKADLELQGITQDYQQVLPGRDEVRSSPPEMRLGAKEWIRRLLDCPEYLGLKLSKAEDAIYQAALELAIHYARARGLSKAVTTVTFHMPAELVMEFAGYKKSTFYVALKRLRSLRLMAVKGKTGDLRGLARKTGSIFCIKLNPRHTHITPRISIEELQHEWRDLNADVKTGKTAFKTLNGESYKSEEVLNAQLLINTWTLPPSKLNPDALHMTLQNGPDAVLDVFDLPTLREAPKKNRGVLVDLLAQGIAARLKDHRSINLYRKVLWQTLRMLDRGIDQLAYLQASIQRAEIALKENAVRKTAGARLMDDWKRSKFWDELRNTPQFRVGPTPKAQA
ncbi:hypothetical protein [Deinococcus misasensis]|uniref:hypothetical protein n=1 Tax=Deinococcus misasensis TaxID=392413 RepID=UPI00054EF018|nr:hypothetical protein [Deinococcus misasensis]